MVNYLERLRERARKQESERVGEWESKRVGESARVRKTAPQHSYSNRACVCALISILRSRKAQFSQLVQLIGRARARASLRVIAKVI